MVGVVITSVCGRVCGWMGMSGEGLAWVPDRGHLSPAVAWVPDMGAPGTRGRSMAIRSTRGAALAQI